MKPLHTVALLLALFTAPMALAAAGDNTACDAKTLAGNKAIARRVFDEVLSRGRIAENEGIYHPRFVAHGPNRDANRDEDRAASAGWRQAAPDLRMDVLRIVAECDLVAVHWSGSGTNTGEGNGLPATGKRMTNLWGMTIFRMEDGKIREEWTSFDQYPMLQQLGLLGADPKAAGSD